MQLSHLWKQLVNGERERDLNLWVKKGMWERAVITPSGGDPPSQPKLLMDSCNLFSISPPAPLAKVCVGVCVCVRQSSTPLGWMLEQIWGVSYYTPWQLAEGRWMMNYLDELICGPVMTQLTTLVTLMKTVNHYIFPFSLYYITIAPFPIFTLGHSVACSRTTYLLILSKKNDFGRKLLVHFHGELINIFPDVCCF